MQNESILTTLFEGQIIDLFNDNRPIDHDENLTKPAITFIDYDGTNIETFTYENVLKICRKIYDELSAKMSLIESSIIEITENNSKKLLRLNATLTIYYDCMIMTPIFILIANLLKLSFYFISSREQLMEFQQKFESLSLSSVFVTHYFHSKELEQSLIIQDEYEKIDTIIDDYCFYIRKCSSSSTANLNDGVEKLKISYIINTSGTSNQLSEQKSSTKTIFVTNESIKTNVLDFKEEFKLNSSDVVLLCSPFSFDPSLCDMYLSLSSFCHLIIADNSLKNVSKKLVKIIKEFNVTYMTITPSFWYRIQAELYDEIESIRLRFVNFGGECCPSTNHLKKFQNSLIEFRNLYGLSEMSVWASMYRIDLSNNDENNDYGVPILGRPLMATKVYLNDSNEIIIESSQRKCLIHHEHKWFMNDKLATKDFGHLVNDEIYFDQRINQQNLIKLNGIKCFPRLIEQSIMNEFNSNQPEFFIENCLIIKSNDQNQLKCLQFIDIIVIIQQLSQKNYDIHGKISNFIHKTYPKIPFRLNLIDSANIICLNQNFKLDYGKLRQNIDTSQLPNWTDELLREKIRSIFNKFIDIDKIAGDRTLNEYGIDSIKATEITMILEEMFELPDDESIYELFFSKSLNQFTTEIVRIIERPSNHRSKRKRPMIGQLNSNETVTIPSNDISSTTTTNDISFNITHVWSYFMEQCVDSSPLVIELDSQTILICTSHAGLINAFHVDQNNYFQLRWSQRITSRIEANPVASFDMNSVFVADYSGRLNAFDVRNGRLTWTAKTDDQLKCTPVIFEDQFVICGSFDHHLYCWQQSDGTEHWKLNISNSPIFSSPAIWYDINSKSAYLIVCTLNGMIGCYNLRNAEKRWKNRFSNKPIFSTPKIHKDSLIVGMIDSRIISVSLNNGNLSWEHQLDKCPIFSSPCIMHDNSNLRIIIGTNNKSIICLRVDGGESNLPTLEWIRQTESNVYANIVFISQLNCAIAVEINGKIHLINVHDEKSIKIAGDFQRFNSEIFSTPYYYSKRSLLFIGCRDSNLHCLSLMKILR